MARNAGGRLSRAGYARAVRSRARWRRRSRRRVADGEPPYQLSVFASSVDLFYRLREAGVEPDVVAGHSLGEYAAAYAAGSLGLDDGVRLVGERDRLMTEAAEKTPGGMVAIIGAGAREVERCRRRGRGRRRRRQLQHAAPDVISGEKEAMEGVARGDQGQEGAAPGGRRLPLAADGGGGGAHGEASGGGRVRRDPSSRWSAPPTGRYWRQADAIRAALREQMLSAGSVGAVMERFSEMGVEEIFEAGEEGR